MLDIYRTYVKCSGSKHCTGNALDVNPLRPEGAGCDGKNLLPQFMSMAYDCVQGKFRTTKHLHVVSISRGGSRKHCQRDPYTTILTRFMPL